MNLTKQEVLNKIEELKKYIEEVEKKEEQDGPLWRAKEGEKYWISCDGHCTTILTETMDDVDSFYFKLGNYFKTIEEAEEYREYLNALGTVRIAILEANDGWVPDWSNVDQGKCYIYRNCGTGIFCSDWVYTYQWLTALPCAKTKKITEEIIKKYNQELEIIFKYLEKNR